MLVGKIEPRLALLRMDRMIGNWLLLWPTLIALMLAGASQHDTKIIAICVVGVFVTRALGCVINDVCDREYDRQVKRTHNRPLANQTLTIKEAFVWACLLATVSFALLTELKWHTIYIAILSAAMIMIYPWMKRVFVIPQLFLAMTFSMCIPIVFFELCDRMTPLAILLYAANVFWVLGFDTVYALADLDDDLKIGVHSSARWLGQFVFVFVAGCYLITSLIWMAILYHCQAGYECYLLTLLSSVLLFKQVMLASHDTSLTGYAFNLNHWAGASYALAILLAVQYG
ncbi:MAG: 4-hydroxybenzoate octaprenyltransferase [Legionellales bacterium]|nr:4-hydroxybenzoate octaprenyltransferase [Legionellales bacterium]|tara:strand:- start:1647 stop:2504 length:858 start_codon:yes stop_codon:yes gene_type:complete